MPGSTRPYFLAYATLLTGLVGVLAGVLMDLSLYNPFPVSFRRLSEDASGPGALLASDLLGVLTLAVVLSYFLLPVAAGGYYAVYGERHPLFYAVLAVVAVLGPPGVLGVLVPLTRTTSLTQPLLIGATTVVTLLIAFSIAVRLGPDEPAEGVPWLVFANVGIVLVVLLGAALGGAVAADAAESIVVVESATGPHAEFTAEYAPIDGDRGTLTIRHVDGQRLRPGNVSLRGEGFADVKDADQVGPGRWQGETTSDPEFEDGPVVADGDAVVVGVSADCEIDLVYHHGTTSEVIDSFDCAEHRGTG